MKSLFKKILKTLETSSSVFSLVALVSVFALPILVSASISSTVSNESVNYGNIPKVVLVDTFAQASTNYDASSSLSNVLGVFTQAKPTLSDQLVTNKEFANTLTKYIEKLGLQNYYLEFEHKGNLNKTTVFQLTNTFNQPLLYELKLSYQVLDKSDNKNASRTLYIDQDVLPLSANAPIYKNLYLLPGQSVSLHLELSNTSSTRYTLELNQIH